LGNWNTTTSPAPVGDDNDWLIVVTGDYHTMALKTDGTLWAWGKNDFGQLGIGTLAHANRPVQVGTMSDWRVVAAGYGHTLAVKADGTLWAWGRNADGQLGNGTAVDETSPVQVGAAQDWQAVAAGDYHTVALKTNGTLWAWGKNVEGQLGDGTAKKKTSPVPIGGIIPSPRFWSIARLMNGRVQLNVGGLTYDTYRVLGSADFLSWEEVGVVTNQAGSASLIDAAAGINRRFYRLVWP